MDRDSAKEAHYFTCLLLSSLGLLAVYYFTRLLLSSLGLFPAYYFTCLFDWDYFQLLTSHIFLTGIISSLLLHMSFFDWDYFQLLLSSLGLLKFISSHVFF